MKLAEVLATTVPNSLADVDVTSVQIDSRKCTPGELSRARVLTDFASFKQTPSRGAG